MLQAIFEVVLESLLPSNMRRHWGSDSLGSQARPPKTIRDHKCWRRAALIGLLFWILVAVAIAMVSLL